MKYIIYTQEHNNGIHRYFYDIWNDRDAANEAAMNLKNEYPIFHKVCSEEDAKALKIEGLPC